ncbi:MAG TPA: monofunctional biosynthetic peptidoglycan transglycosylase [Bryobacteraceae bacterium]|nr:monofunctional biosynthetic peptidoglycan transglycosylase [Bryobacteraceae bacterium]
MFRRILIFVFGVVAAVYVFWTVALFALRVVNPPTTGVQIQRRVESWVRHTPYRKRQTFVPLSKISPELQHAVISAEDGRFYQHHGIDWDETEKVAQETQEKGELIRGASTIPQQLVKNLFFTTHRNPLRKLLEYTLAPMADRILGKRRELELYLNVVEWGPGGVYGIEEGARYHYHVSAARLDREQAARLAAILPAPRRWHPARMDDYSAIILGRMEKAGW